MALTQQELEGRLWAAANSLRGPVDPADFKAYIFPLLFYKGSRTHGMTSTPAPWPTSGPTCPRSGAIVYGFSVGIYPIPGYPVLPDPEQ